VALIFRVRWSNTDALGMIIRHTPASKLNKVTIIESVVYVLDV
jgi:hypothetical protein